MKKTFVLMLGWAFFSHFSTTAQAQVTSPSDTLPPMQMETRKTYEIGGIKVVGNRYSDANAIIGVSGLKVGGKIALPGTDLSRCQSIVETQTFYRCPNR